MGKKIPENVRIESKEIVQKYAKLKYTDIGTFDKLEQFREDFDNEHILVPKPDTVRSYYYGQRLIQEKFLPFMAIALGASEDVLKKENIEKRALQKEEQQKKRTRHKKIVELAEHYDHDISDVINNRHAVIIRTYTILKTYGLSILLTFNDDLKNQFNQKGRYIGNIKNNLINLAKYDDEEQLNDFGTIDINDFLRIFDSEKLKTSFVIGSKEITLILKNAKLFGADHNTNISLTGTEILRFLSDIDSEIQHRLSFWSISSHPDDQINYMKIEQNYVLSSLDK